MSSSASSLRVLIVEDEAMVAFLLEDMLSDLGHEVGAVASRMHEALDLAHTGVFDLAILDVNLNGQPSYPVAEILRGRGIPTIFATGYGSKGLNRDFSGTPVLAKPFVLDDLRKMLQQVPDGKL